MLGGLATLNYTIPPGFKVYDDINKYDFDLAEGQGPARAVQWDVTKPFRLDLLADDPNFTVTAPAIQQYLQDIGPQGRADGPADGSATATRSRRPPTGKPSSRSAAPRASAGIRASSTTRAPASATTQLKLPKDQCIYDDMFNAAAAVTGDPQDASLHKLALTLNDNLPEIYLWQPNYLHVYREGLGGGFAIYPNERESFKKILDWTYNPCRSRTRARIVTELMQAPAGRLPSQEQEAPWAPTSFAGS